MNAYSSVPISDGHLAFRRKNLDTFYHGDVRLFDSKYPPGPRDGWLTGGSVAIPLDAVEALILDAEAAIREGRQAPENENEEVFYEAREVGAPYLLTADPAKYGQASDPSAWTLWHGWDRREVGAWSGRMDPGALADRILQVQRRYDCHVLVESNAGECCEALKARACPRLVWDSGHPGFHSTEARKGQALADLVDMLRRGELRPVTLATLNQLASWDGTSRSRKGGHHHDRAITCMLAAWYFTARAGFGSRPTPRTSAIRPILIPKARTWNDALADEKKDKESRARFVLGRSFR
jgi:hypothetical protein